MSDSEIVLYAGYALVFGAVYLIANMLMREEQTRAAADALEDGGNRKSSSALVKFLRPFFSQYLVPMVRGKPLWDGMRRTYKRKLIAAGLREELNPDEMIAFKLILIVFFPIAGGLAIALGLIDLPVMGVLALGIVGWFYPDFWANSRIKSRQAQIIKTLPFVVDLLALSTEAGMDFVGAISKVVEKAKQSPLTDELAQVLKEIRVGSSRAEALREMAARIDMIEVNSFIAVLISADEMGSPIGRVLRQQSDQIRSQRIIRAEKAGARAATQIMLPIVFLIVPAVMLMIFGPFLLSFLGGRGGG